MAYGVSNGLDRRLAVAINQESKKNEAQL